MLLFLKAIALCKWHMWNLLHWNFFIATDRWQAKNFIMKSKIYEQNNLQFMFQKMIIFQLFNQLFCQLIYCVQHISVLHFL